MKNRIIFDEVKFIQDIKNKQIDKINIKSASIFFTREYFTNFKDNWSNEKSFEYVIANLKSLYDNLEISDNIYTIKKNITKYSKPKYFLKQSEGIKIYKSELSHISSLNNKHLEILAFSILVLKKVDNFKKNKKSTYFNMEFRDYYKSMTGDKGDMKRQNKSIKSLSENNLIKLPDLKDIGRSKGFNLNYINFDSNDIEFIIDDIREIPLYYKKWCGENIEKCEICNRLIELKSNRSKYCVKCAKEMELKKYAKYNAKRK